MLHAAIVPFGQHAILLWCLAWCHDTHSANTVLWCHDAKHGGTMPWRCQGTMVSWMGVPRCHGASAMVLLCHSTTHSIVLPWSLPWCHSAMVLFCHGAGYGVLLPWCLPWFCSVMVPTMMVLFLLCCLLPYCLPAMLLLFSHVACHSVTVPVTVPACRSAMPAMLTCCLPCWHADMVPAIILTADMLTWCLPSC